MRIKYLDVLKAFAIIVVVLYHAGILTYGYLGVDVFLVVAGYLTTRSLYKGEIKYFSFEINRVARLLPPLLLAGIVCVLVGYFAMLPDDYENLSLSVIATNFFGNNILAALTTKNYWDVVNEYKPLMHTWYVGVLMQFYLVYPILFCLAKLDKKNPKSTLMIMMGSLAVVSLLLYFAISDNAIRFYYLPCRFFEFAVGGVVALIYKPGEDTPLGKWFVYTCYMLLLVLMVTNMELMPAMVRLVAVVALSSVLLCSQNILENKVTGNIFLSKIGAASYSIFVWHQIVLAYCRYMWTSQFSPQVYGVILIVTIVLSWLSYEIVEQGIPKFMKTKKGKMWFYSLMVVVLILLSLFSGYIYMNAGVVRDVPELYISKKDSFRMNHKAYNDKIYKMDKPFETNKKHWLVIGNSFGRDFANVILESNVADSVELSYIYMDDYDKPEKVDRYANADMIFLSSLGTTKATVSQVESICMAVGFPKDKLIIVGTKNFGECNGQFYVKRGSSDYFELRTKMEKPYYSINKELKDTYGNRYLDLIGLVENEDGTMPVFTPDHKFISQDCRHFSMGGAKWFARLIEWDMYLN